MISDFARTDCPSEYQADICIVGSGAAGISLALELSGNSNLNVIVLESGSLTVTERPQALLDGEVSGDPFSGLREGRARALGGATRLWYGQCVRLQPIDFETRSWVPYSGWPIRICDLEPWYRKAETFFEVGTEDLGDPVYGKFSLNPPGWDPSAARTHCTVYSPIVDFGRIFQKKLERSRNVHVLLNATAVEVNVGENGRRAEGVTIRSLSGNSSVVKSRVVVLCGGGIENPRLLLASNRVVKDGLGNSRDLVGRFFQDHPNGFTATLHALEPNDLQRRFSLLYWKHLRYFPKFSIAAERQTERRILNSTSHLSFEYEPDTAVQSLKEFARALRRRRLPDNAARHAARMLSDPKGIAEGLASVFGKGVSPGGAIREIKLRTFLEQAPNPSSRITLSAKKDALGVPQPRVEWQLTDLERRTALEAARTFSAEFERLGIGSLSINAALDTEQWQEGFVDAFHHAGTTRMASSPTAGVVDPNLEVFEVPGLYVAGSSVFPTSGWANPTLTIVGLSMRLSARLCERSKWNWC